jgi:hypothetical protein
VAILVSSVPPIESLKSKTTLKNLTNLLRVLLFKDSSEEFNGPDTFVICLVTATAAAVPALTTDH